MISIISTKIQTLIIKFWQDEAIRYSFIKNSWALISNLVTMFFIIRFFSPDLQGYYYTFNNLLLLQTFLDIGFGQVLIQFISHEMAHLAIKQDIIEGDTIPIQRLASLIKISKKWYSIVSVLFFFVIGTIGYFFIASKNNSLIETTTPWILLCIAVSINLLLIPWRCWLEGSNQIKVVQKKNVICITNK